MNSTVPACAMRTLIALCLLLGSLLPLRAQMPLSAEPPKREFRGAWIATVWGIDWPSVTGTTQEVAQRQRKELEEMLQRLADAGVNAVFFHARPMADALYRSAIEPWSAMLTGERGAAPAKGWDPLAFCVEKAHELGMECHAWINPFRFPAPASASDAAADQKAMRRGWVINYRPTAKKSKAKKTEQPKTTSVVDPGNPQARAHIVNVCRDIVANYDIDGLVFDDYFYPHGLPLGGGYDFDEWQASGSPLSQADWRRENVNTAVRQVKDMILLTKPHVRFGISPAGVAGNDGAASSIYGLPRCYAGHDWMYDGIYCDPLAWMAEGTIDYVSPQIYWSSTHSTNPYVAIADWWAEAATHFGLHSFPSVITRAFADSDASAPEEAAKQLAANRREPHGGGGTVFYSAKTFLAPDQADVRQRLADKEFRHKALPPEFKRNHSHTPGMVEGLRLQGDKLRWEAMEDMRFAVYAVPTDVDPLDAFDGLEGGLSARYLLGISYTNSFTLPKELKKGHWYAVSPLDRFGREWETSTLF